MDPVKKEEGPITISIEISRQEYLGLEDVFKKHGLAVEIPGWNPSPYLRVIKRLVETIRKQK